MAEGDTPSVLSSAPRGEGILVVRRSWPRGGCARRDPAACARSAGRVRAAPLPPAPGTLPLFPTPGACPAPPRQLRPSRPPCLPRSGMRAPCTAPAPLSFAPPPPPPEYDAPPLPPYSLL